MLMIKLLKLSPAQLEALNEKRNFLLKLEEQFEKTQEEAVLKDNWEVASKMQNRVNLTFRVRSRLEASVWLEENNNEEINGES